MKERPILFSAPMVRAILGGNKTQTRRVVKPQPGTQMESVLQHNRPEWPCPYGNPGVRLWVRETFADLRGTGIEHRSDPSGPLQRYAFAADCLPGSYRDQARRDFGVKWKPSIHMPRAASRITLEITGVRVERLSDCSETDAIAEGIERCEDGVGWRRGPVSGDIPNTATRTAFPKLAYQSLWESINGTGSWDANPWVWVVEFKRVEGGAA